MLPTWRDASVRETRLDGKQHAVEPLLFYAALPGGAIFRGNARGVRGEGSGDTAPWQQMFASFERELAQHAPHDELSADAEEGLRALGYLD